jgi:hypothetical protein
MAKDKKISVKELAELYAKDGGGDLINEVVDAIFLFRKVTRDDSQGYSITGGGNFRQNDAAMVIITMMEMMDLELDKGSIPQPEDMAEFGLLRLLFKEFTQSYIKAVGALRKVIDEKVKDLEEENEEEKESKGEGTDA